MRFEAKNHISEAFLEYKSMWPPKLELLLASFMNQEASDARDKVYAYLGIAAQELNIPVS